MGREELGDSQPIINEWEEAWMDPGPDEVVLVVLELGCG
jgi:hypothetical protein